MRDLKSWKTENKQSPQAPQVIQPDVGPAQGFVDLQKPHPTSAHGIRGMLRPWIKTGWTEGTERYWELDFGHSK